MLTASFLLIFMVMFLDSTMFAIAAYLYYSKILSTNSILLAMGVLFGLLTLQVGLYQYMLWREIIGAMKSDRLQKKWEKLIDINDQKFPQPKFSNSTVITIIIGFDLSILFIIFAALL